MWLNIQLCLATDQAPSVLVQGLVGCVTSVMAQVLVGHVPYVMAQGLAGLLAGGGEINMEEGSYFVVFVLYF